MEIYLLRHGVTEWNDLYKIQGASDILLNKDGISMAKQTGEHFDKEGITFDAVYSSPLSRAMNSAKLVSRNDAPVSDARLREMGFGKQEGMSVFAMKEAGDIPFSCFKEEPSKYDEMVKAYDPHAETFVQILARAGEFLKDVIETKEAALEEDGNERRILISGHGALDQALIFIMKKKENIDDFWKGGLLPNCGIDIIKYNPQTGEYTFVKEMEFYYETELFEKAPRLLK